MPLSPLRENVTGGIKKLSGSPLQERQMQAPCHQNIVRTIEKLIRTGGIKPGERLPAERKMAYSYGVSRNTIREAIKVLTENGVVTSRRGAGTFVAADGLGAILDNIEKGRRRLREIFELRRLLEPQIAALAAQRITDAQLDELAGIVDMQQSGTASTALQAELDERFHRLIARAAGNSLLGELYDKLQELVAESRNEELQNRTRSQLSQTHHAQLVTALRQRSPETAASLMHRHMEAVEHTLLPANETIGQDTPTSV